MEMPRMSKEPQVCCGRSSRLVSLPDMWFSTVFRFTGKGVYRELTETSASTAFGSTLL